MARLEDYRPYVGAETLEEIRLLARHLDGRSVTHVNSTATGGGVAEILNRLVPLMNELGLQTRWEVIKGGNDFFAMTKKVHNTLHGDPGVLAPRDFQTYEDTIDENLRHMNFDSDVVFVHDPQPAALVKKRQEYKNRWLWRCHIDLSSPNTEVWDFFKRYVESYDMAVFSAAAFGQKLSIPQVLVAPSIDPLSEKNREMEASEIQAVLDRLQIPRDKPLVTQVSRFDRLKDPLGVIQAFESIKPYADARLLLVGGTADDDPEGAQVLAEVKERAGNNPDVIIMALPPTSHLEINAIQRASAVIFQKSLREGFGLTVSEALWKGKPVIAGAVGGIPLQITHKHSGVLVHSVEGASYWLKQLLNEPGFARRLGETGREEVRQNFLLTRQLRDYLLAFISLEHIGEDMVRLHPERGTAC